MNEGFSVALGLFDYINPICYTTFSIIGFKHFRKIMKSGFFYVYLIGCIISLVGGFTIPTIKTLVGLGIIEWGLPVKPVTIANFGFLVSGPTLFLGTLKCNRRSGSDIMLMSSGLSLAFLNKFIVGFGAFGMIMIYVTTAKLAFERKRPYAAITLIVSLCGTLFESVYSNIGTDLNSPAVHWVIEIGAVITHVMLVVSAYLLFVYKDRKQSKAA